MAHHLDVPPALEALVTRLDELKVVVGPAAAPRLEVIRGHLTRASALRSSGDPPGATAAITAAMSELAALADAVDPSEASIMRAVVHVFGAALARGEDGEMKRTADVMRERSGSHPVDDDE